MLPASPGGVATIIDPSAEINQVEHRDIRLARVGWRRRRIGAVC
jgi:hypothetical protein